MKTASAGELQDRSNTTFQNLSVRIDARGDRPLTKALTEKVDAWGESRIEILHAISGLNQVAEYGAERFAKSFVRMQELHRCSTTLPKGMTESRLRDLVWKALPSSPFKRFQELFCEPRNYVVPHFTISAYGQIDFGKELDRRTKSVAPCIVAPHLISDGLVESLGLATFTEAEQNSAILRFFRKAKVDVRHSLKERWDNANPLSDRDFRIMVLRKPTIGETANLAAEYPFANPMPRGLHGSILMSRAAIGSGAENQASGLLQPRKTTLRVAAHYLSAFAALRKTAHQRAGYDVETVELATISANLRRIGERIGVEWRRGASEEVKSDLLSSLKKTASEALDIVAGSLEPKKIEIGRRISHCQDLRDKLDRLNAKSTESHIFKSIDLVEKRIVEVAHKGGYNETDRTLLSAELGKQIAIIKTATESLRELPFATRTGNKDVGRLQKVLAANESELPRVTLKPLSTFAGIIRLCGITARNALDKKQSTRGFTAHIELTSRLFDAAVSFENIRLMIATDGPIDVPNLVRQSNNFRTSIPHTALLGTVEGRKTSEALGALDSRIRAHIKRFQDVMKSESKQVVWTEQLRELLRAVNIEEMALSLIPTR